MQPLVVLVDVDHTLLDGDAVRDRISEAVSGLSGPAAAARFWVLYDAVRAELGRVDVPETATRLDRELGRAGGASIEAVERADFASCLCEGALEVLAHLGRLGVTAVLSDGEPRFQRVKIASAGIADAVGDRVVIATHKERELDEVQRRFPAAHYALLDDRVGILAAVKGELGARVTTVLVRQGRYAGEIESAPGVRRPDLVVGSIREVLGLGREALMRAPS
jgi:FMN phosphatase YigB (HAD superfamily)